MKAIQMPAGNTVEKAKNTKWLLLGLGAVGILLLAGLFIGIGKMINKPVEAQTANPDVLRAVFLDNGQVYFGKVTNQGDKSLTLTNIYYLQSDKSTTASMDSSQDLKLVKLGNELHGPEDMMEINMEHVLFIEQLKSDSKVVKAIAEYKK